jgi:hypothetical protein
MKTYRIEFTRSVEQLKYIEIEAENEGEAHELAKEKLLDIDENDEWDDVSHTGDPQIVGVVEIEDDDEDEKEMADAE